MIERRKPEHASIRAQIDLAKHQEFVTIDQLALLLQVSPLTIRRRLPRFPQVIRDGRMIRIHRVTAIAAWVRQHTQSPQSQKVDVNSLS